MKILGKIMDVICAVMTKYFLIWCPKERACKFTKRDNTDKKFEEYKEYYTETTRWV